MSAERVPSYPDGSGIPGIDTADLQRAIDIYETELAARLEPSHSGETVAIHVPTGDFEVARNSAAALRGIRTRHPQGPVVTMGIGYDRPNPSLDSRLALSNSLRQRL